MRRLVEFLVASFIGAGIVWFLTQPRIGELEGKIQLLEARIFELQTRYENDFNSLREEYDFLHKQIQELKRATLTSEMKDKVEHLFSVLEQTYRQMN